MNSRKLSSALNNQPLVDSIPLLEAHVTCPGEEPQGGALPSEI